MAYPTLLDIAKRNTADMAVGLIDEASKAHPEVMVSAARTVKGINFSTLVRTAVGTGNSFRDANEGNTPRVNTYINRLVECFIFDPQFQVDLAVAQSSEDGPEAFLATEAGGILEGAMQELATQFYYGTTSPGNASGFPGLVSMVSTSQEVTAGGSGSDCSSIWAVRWAPNGLQWVIGQNGQFALSDPAIIQAKDGDGKVYPAYWMHLTARIGLALLDSRAVGRVKNIEPDAKCDDDDIANLLATFPAGLPPTALYMSRRSLNYLRDSRTATNATGAPAPFPVEAFGIPIFATDAITDTETNS